MPPTQTAVIVPIPEAEPVVSGCRARLDRYAGWGVPAHVTVLYPFLPPDRIDDRVLRELAEAIGAVPAFETTLARVRWFGDQVLWLAPEPDLPFQALTEAVHARFPRCSPYGGAHLTNVPHLTVGHDAAPAELRAAEATVRPRLPIKAWVRAAELWSGAPEPATWRPVADLPLGPAAPTRPRPTDPP